MTADHAIDVLSSALKQLAEVGFVCSGELAFIQPRVAGLVTAEAVFERSPVPRLVMRTVRRDPLPTVAASSMTAAALEADAEHAAGFISGDTCVRCGGGRMQQAGACKVCLDCGEAGGCG